MTASGAGDYTFRHDTGQRPGSRPPLRGATGALFVAAGAGKLLGDFVHGVLTRSAEEMARASWPLWKSFLQSAVLPNAGVFGWVFAFAELAVGIGVFLGLTARVAAAGGAALMSPFYSASPTGPARAGTGGARPA